jgi:hypothetical protein
LSILFLFGPAALLRGSVTALAAPDHLPAACLSEPAPDAAAKSPSTKRRSRLDWAALLKRVFRIDILECARCGGGMSVVAFITERKATVRILENLGLPTQAPAKARAPPWTSLSA